MSLKVNYKDNSAKVSAEYWEINVKCDKERGVHLTDGRLPSHIPYFNLARNYRCLLLQVILDLQDPIDRSCIDVCIFGTLKLFFMDNTEQLILISISHQGWELLNWVICHKRRWEWFGRQNKVTIRCRRLVSEPFCTMVVLSKVFKELLRLSRAFMTWLATIQVCSIGGLMASGDQISFDEQLQNIEVLKQYMGIDPHQRDNDKVWMGKILWRLAFSIGLHFSGSCSFRRRCRKWWRCCSFQIRWYELFAGIYTCT